MALEVRHNRAEHSHENYQFRRVAESLIKLFDHKGWDGLLIGNPDSEDFSRFRADAILFYNHGLIILDLKDYHGKIQIPKRDDDFAITKWYSETEKDKQRIEIKGGNSFINPFMQLKSYRQVMYEVINTNPVLKANLNPSRVCAINLFSGPIELNRRTPRNVPYYQIVDEEGLANFLYDYNSVNTFAEDSAKALKGIFPASEWEEVIEIPEEKPKEPGVKQIDSDVESEITEFLEKDESGILVLESMEYNKRDEWVNYILREASNHGIPQTEVWSHSSRIKRKIKQRSGIQSHSIYTSIYGGKQKKSKDKDDEEEENEERLDEREIIGLKSDDILDEKGLIILHEGHLVTRSLNQSPLLRFGSGRLLEDFLSFMRLDETNRKLICIGDPFSLSYGNENESALAQETLKELYSGFIDVYRDLPSEKSSGPIVDFRVHLANSIDASCFNNLSYPFDQMNFTEKDKLQTLEVLKAWFSEPVTSEPGNSMLVFSNKDAQKINLFIKQHYLKNSANLSPGDLLLMNNNIKIPDETGLGIPTSITNGMYLLVKEVLEEQIETVNSKSFKHPVELKFQKLKIRCLSLDNKPEAIVWLSSNYFNGEDKLSKEEEIAFRVYVNKKLAAYLKINSFEESEENRKLQQDNKFLELQKKISILNKALNNGEKVKTKLDQEKREANKIEKTYRKDYREFVQRKIYSEDPFLNAVQAKYGWCITVHKAVGSRFENICVNGSQGENRGYSNENYFRWLYSAVSTSYSKIHLLNSIEIGPLMDCRFVDIDEVGWANKESKELEFPNYEIPQEFNERLAADINHNVKSAISIFSSHLAQSGILLERTAYNNQYLAKAFYSITDDDKKQLVIAFNSNGKSKVTSIRTESNGEILNGEFEKGLEKLIAASGEDNQPKSKNIPRDFRFEIYNNWIEQSKLKGGNLLLIESHEYDDVFLFTKENEMVEFKVYFNNRGFISVITILRKSIKEISRELENILLNGR